MYDGGGEDGFEDDCWFVMMRERMGDQEVCGRVVNSSWSSSERRTESAPRSSSGTAAVRNPNLDGSGRISAHKGRERG